MIKYYDYINLYIPEILLKNKEFLDMRFDSIYFKNDPQRILENLMIIVHIILQARNTEQYKSKLHNCDIEFPVCSIILQNHIKGYKNYLNFLVDINFVEETFAPTERFCGKFQILPPYDQAPIIKQRLYRKKNLRKNSVFTKIIGSSNISEVIKDTYFHQYQSYNNFSVDWSMAFEKLNTLFPNDLIRKDYMERILYNIDQFDTHSETSHELEIFKSGVTNRLYSPISLLKKELRSCLLFDNKKLIEIDFKNSIPFMGLGLMYDFEFNDLYKEHILFKGEVYRGEDIILGKIGRQVDGVLSEYANDVCDGSIYNRLADLWDMSRKDAKQKILVITNIESYKIRDNRYWLSFQELYPVEAAIIANLNKNYGSSKLYKKAHTIEDDKAHCRYAYLTQKMEAYIMLNYIPNMILKENSDIPFVTLHDAIYLPQGEEKYGKKIECWVEQITGLKPSVTLKSL